MSGELTFAINSSRIFPRIEVDEVLRFFEGKILLDEQRIDKAEAFVRGLASRRVFATPQACIVAMMRRSTCTDTSPVFIRRNGLNATTCVGSERFRSTMSRSST